MVEKPTLQRGETMSLDLVKETITRVNSDNAEILNKYVDKYPAMDRDAKDVLMRLCYLMLDELGDEEE